MVLVMTDHPCLRVGRRTKVNGRLEQATHQSARAGAPHEASQVKSGQGSGQLALGVHRELSVGGKKINIPECAALLLQQVF
jgi:hypothetical protein